MRSHNSLLILGALVLLGSLIPAIELAWAWTAGGTLSGADGVWTLDQFQYLAWIRESGEHFFAANLFDIPRSHGLLTHPVWLMSGVLWKLGLPIQYALIPPKILGILATWWAVRCYCDRWGFDRFHGPAAMALAVFYVSPFVALAPTDEWRWALLLYSGEMATGLSVWGDPLVTISTALLVLSALTIEQALQRERATYSQVATASLLGFAAAWIHPWQGVTIAFLAALLIASDRASRRVWWLVAVGAWTSLPLVAYLILGHLDSSWNAARQATAHPRFWLALMVTVAPLMALAALGARRAERASERVPYLWIAAALGNFLLNPAWPSHALGGMAVPLAVLAVRGLGRAGSPAVTVCVTALLVLPGVLYHTEETVKSVTSNIHERAEVLTADEAKALRYLEARPDGDGVLAKPFLAGAIPAWTGHPVWAGHQVWTPSFDSRVRQIDSLMAGALKGDSAMELIRKSGVRYLLARCEDNPDFSGQAGIVVLQRFGCVTVYEAAIL